MLHTHGAFHGRRALGSLSQGCCTEVEGTKWQAVTSAGGSTLPLAAHPAEQPAGLPDITTKLTPPWVSCDSRTLTLLASILAPLA